MLRWSQGPGATAKCREELFSSRLFDVEMGLTRARVRSRAGMGCGLLVQRLVHCLPRDRRFGRRSFCSQKCRGGLGPTIRIERRSFRVELERLNQQLYEVKGTLPGTGLETLPRQNAWGHDAWYYLTLLNSGFF